MTRERLYLFDTTLRDGALTTGVDFSLDDKLNIAGLLDRLDRAIYAPPGETWDGAQTWRHLEPAIEAHERQGQGLRADALPDLYPRPGG